MKAHFTVAIDVDIGLEFQRLLEKYSLSRSATFERLVLEEVKRMQAKERAEQGGGEK